MRMALKYTLLVILLCSCILAQTKSTTSTTTSSITTTQTPIGDTINVAFNLLPMTLPGAGTSVTGAETDALIPFTTNNWLGTTIIASSQYNFIGGKYNRMFPQINQYLSKYNSTIFSSGEFGVTGSVGVVNSNNQSHWGQSAGVMWIQNISNTWAMGFDAEWINLPGFQHNTYKVAIGPTLKF